MTWPWQSQNRTPAELFKEVDRAIRQVTSPTADGPTLSGNELLGANLGLSSLAVARLAGILQKRLGRKSLPFQKLLVAPDGTLLHDIRIADLVAFLERELRDPS